MRSDFGLHPCADIEAMAAQQALAPGKRRIPPLIDLQRIFQYMFGLPNVVQIDPDWKTLDDIADHMRDKHLEEGEPAKDMVLAHPMDWQYNGYATIFRTFGTNPTHHLVSKAGAVRIELTHAGLGLPAKADLGKLEWVMNWSKSHASLSLKGTFTEWLLPNIFQPDVTNIIETTADTSAKRQRLHKKAAPTLTVFGKMGAYSEAMLTPQAPS